MAATVLAVQLYVVAASTAQFVRHAPQGTICITMGAIQIAGTSVVDLLTMAQRVQSVPQAVTLAILMSRQIAIRASAVTHSTMELVSASIVERSLEVVQVAIFLWTADVLYMVERHREKQLSSSTV